MSEVWDHEVSEPPQADSLTLDLDEVLERLAKAV
jgi:hypothetical protein